MASVEETTSMSQTIEEVVNAVVDEAARHTEIGRAHV